MKGSLKLYLIANAFLLNSCGATGSNSSQILGVIALLIVALIIIYLIKKIISSWSSPPTPCKDPIPSLKGDEIFRFVDIRAPQRADNQVEEGDLLITSQSAYIKAPKDIAKVTESSKKKSESLVQKDQQSDTQKNSDTQKKGPYSMELDEFEQMGNQFLSNFSRLVGEITHASSASFKNSEAPELDLGLDSHIQYLLKKENIYNRIWDNYIEIILSRKRNLPLIRRLTTAIRYYNIVAFLKDNPLESAEFEVLQKIAGSKILIPQNALEQIRIPTDQQKSHERATIDGVNILGIGELRLVRQEINRYEMSEIAHIENVMASEKRERKHTVTDKEEIRILLEEERIKEESRDLETSERFELAKEVESQAQTNMELQTDLNITYNYGTVVSINSDTSFAMQESREQANRRATKYSKDLVDRTINRIQERVRSVRETTKIYEIVESNLHGFDNSQGNNHITGVYRWLNKFYDSKLINYGRRLMIEVHIPEPARKWLDLYLNPAKTEAITNRQEPKHPSESQELNGETMSLNGPSELTPENYRLWTAHYGVDEVGSVPEPVTISKNYKSGSANEIFKDYEEDFVVPEGYKGIGFRYTAYIQIHDNDVDPNSTGISNTALNIFVGTWTSKNKVASNDIYLVPASGGGPGYNAYLYEADVWYGAEMTEVNVANYDLDILQNGLTGQVPITLIGENTQTYTVHLEVYCVPVGAYSKWQNDTFGKILEAYSLQVKDYEEYLNRQRDKLQTLPDNRNPLKNRHIEQTELRKQAIAIITRQKFENFDSIQNDPYFFDFEETEKNGSYAQFFEQAFEWRNISYSFYPYFWARREQWDSMQANQDADALFERFIHAGMARVVVPVRPAYNRAIMEYLYGLRDPDNPWNKLYEEGNGDPPTVDDELYVAIEEDLLTYEDHEELAGQSWEAKLPTDLIILEARDGSQSIISAGVQ